MLVVIFYQLIDMVCWLLWSAGCYFLSDHRHGVLVAMVCWLLWCAGCYGILVAIFVVLQETPMSRFVQGYAGAISAALGIAVS